MANEKELLDEIESTKKRLRDEIKEKEKEADERLDEILSKRKMQFCPRCGRKISSRMDWAGKCLHDGCEELICSQCWSAEEKRYCKKHDKDYRKREEATQDDIKNLTLNYMEFAEYRLKKFRLDWNHEGFIKKAKISRQKKKYGEFEMVVYEKKFLSRKPKVRILVRPLTEAFQEEINSALENVDGKNEIYTNLVFIGGSASIGQKALRLANEFSNKKVSLFVMDMESGKLNFNAREALADKYSCWLDPTKMPVTFANLLKQVSESVAGKKIVYAKKFGEQFGKTEGEAADILRKSGMLEEAKGTNSFILKE
jgi:actin-related protein